VRWHCQAKLFGGLEIEGQLELHWLFHRQIDGLSALKNAIDIDRYEAASPERLLLYLKQPNASAHLLPELGRDKARYVTARFLIPPV
jgi:hypothetical protein